MDAVGLERFHRPAGVVAVVVEQVLDRVGFILGSRSLHRAGSAFTVTVFEYTDTAWAPSSNSRRASTLAGFVARAALSACSSKRSIAMPVIERFVSKLRTSGLAPRVMVTVSVCPA